MEVQNTHDREVRLLADQVDHPVMTHLRVGDRVEVILSSTVIGPTNHRWVTNQAALDRAITAYMAPDVKLLASEPHPDLSRLVCLWASRRRWSRHHREYKQRVATASISRGGRSVAARTEKWRKHSTSVANGLTKLDGRCLRRIVGMGPWGEQLLQRLKLHALSTYDPLNDKVGCPHEGCVHLTDVTLHHVFWECEAATHLRRHILQPWRRHGVTDAGLERAIFGLQLQETPAGIWDVMGTVRNASDDPHQQLTAIVATMTECCWRLGAAVYLQSVWRWCVNHFDQHNNITRGHHTATMLNKLNHGYGTVQLYSKAAATSKIGEVAASVMRKALRAPTLELNPLLAIPTGTRYLLYFGGRARGKIRADGSGAIVIATGNTIQDSSVIWLASMSYATGGMSAHTASGLGLYTGLRECARKQYTPLHVIGVNPHVVAQQRRRKPPQAKPMGATF